MKTFSQVREDFAEFFKGAKDISGGIAKLTPYITALTTGVAVGGAPLTIATIVVLAATAFEGCSSIIAVLAEPRKAYRKLNKLDAAERFDLIYHMLCQESYADAVREILSKMDENLYSTTLDHKALSKVDRGDLQEIRTGWNYDLDLSGCPFPLFEAYAERLRVLFISTGIDKEYSKKVMARIDEMARRNIKLQLTTKKPPYDWVYDYVQFEALTKIRASADSLPDNIAKAITEAAARFLDAQKTSGSTKAWDDYRIHLGELANRDIFGSQIGIRDLYVLPSFTYYRQGQRIAGPEATQMDEPQLPLRNNLPQFLTHLISKRTPRDNLIFIFGDPGVGKTSFGQMYANALSSCKSFHPLYIPLQYIDPTRDLVPEIERYVRESTLRDAVRELHNCSNVVFILDAFDELAQATRDRMGDFFRRLERFTTDQLYRAAATIATGRHTLFSKSDALIPAGTHVITLQPFDEGQIKEWSVKWNKLAGQSFDGTKFWQSHEARRGDLHDIATQPLLLYLLAKLEQSGTPVNPADVDTSRSGIYRHIIQWVCNRQQEKWGSSLGNPMSAGQMRKLLRLTGFCAMSRGRRAVHLDDLQSMLGDAGLSEETVQDKNNYQAERTFLTFAFAKTGQASWEFKHKQFGEYLAAEYIAERFDVAIKRVPDPDEPGESDGRRVMRHWRSCGSICLRVTVSLLKSKVLSNRCLDAGPNS